MRSKRSSSRLNLSSHAKVRSTRILKAWRAALNNRFRPRLGVLRLRGFSLMLGITPRIEDHLPIASGITAAIEVAIGSAEVQPHLFGHLLQRVEALREQDHVGLIDGR